VSNRSHVMVTVEKSLSPELYEHLVSLKRIAQDSYMQFAFDMHVATLETSETLEFKILTRDVAGSVSERTSLAIQAAMKLHLSTNPKQSTALVEVKQSDALQQKEKSTEDSNVIKTHLAPSF
jgi:hypothetical protein